MNTPALRFRLSADTLADIDAIVAYLATRPKLRQRVPRSKPGASRTEAIRYAVALAARRIRGQARPDQAGQPDATAP